MVTIAPSSATGNYLRGTGDKEALFSCPIHWVIRGATSGFVVQRVQRNEKYTADRAGTDTAIITGADYWEAWEIDSSGNAQPLKGGVNDNFGVYRANTLHQKSKGPVICPPKNGTRGRWKIRGTVYYVAAAAFDAAGWSRYIDPVSLAITHQLGSVPMAGMLLSRYDAPTAGDGLQPRATLGNVLCTRQFAGTWDWTVKPPLSTRRRWPLGGNFDSEITGV